jgi:tRNA (guanine-N7-)-methyltransferase
MNSETPAKRRPIRSFVVRPGRLTEGQRNAIERSWPELGLEVADGPVDLERVFNRRADTVLEIGFGMGASLMEMAANQPELNYIGIEVHPPGVGSLLLGCEERALENIRVYREDAVEVLKNCIANESLSGVQLYFPDPWPKKRHHKRRIVQPEFIALAGAKLVRGGFLHMATDWQQYAEYMLQVMAGQTAFVNSAGTGKYSEKPQWRPKTKFELRGERLGHGVWDLLFYKC